MNDYENMNDLVLNSFSLAIKVALVEFNEQLLLAR